MLVLPVEELLAMVNCPVAAPADAGSNSRLSVSVAPGFSVTGNAAPDTLKPAPVKFAELTVTGRLPEDDRVMLCVAGVFSVTSPKATLAAIALSTGEPAFNCRLKL